MGMYISAIAIERTNRYIILVTVKNDFRLLYIMSCNLIMNRLFLRNISSLAGTSKAQNYLSNW